MDGQQLPDRNVRPDEDAMTPYQQQIALEAWMRRVGAGRAIGGQWEAGANSFMAYRMIGPYLSVVLDQYHRGKQIAGRQGMIWDLLGNEANVKQVALESLFSMFGSLNELRRYNPICARLGKQAEYVLWLNHPLMKTDHLTGLRLASNNDLGMSAMMSRLRDKGFRKMAHYKPLTLVERTALGAFFIEAMSVSTQMFNIEIEQDFRGRKCKVIVPTELYWSFLSRWKQNLMMFRPAYMPMIVPPKDYTTLDDGGYLSIVTGCMKVPWESFPAAIEKAQPCVLGALNRLQSMPMAIEPEQVSLILDLWQLGTGVGDLPPRDRAPSVSYSLERSKGKGKSEIWRMIWKSKHDRTRDGQRAKIVNMLSSYEQLQGRDELFWTWQMDSRGRLYPRGSQINYQGGDPYRSMLTFTRGAKLLRHTREFAWALGDAWGCAVDWKERLAHLEDQSGLIRRMGEDPVRHVATWELAKRPFRYIQLCREWARAMADPEYQTRAVFQLDQTTSGYGHLACLLRDGAMARATNVTGDAHKDLYSTMAEAIHHVAFDEYARIEDPKKKELIQWWLDHWPERKLFKPAIMPYIYGRKYMSLQVLIAEHLIAEFQHSQSPEGHQAVALAHSLARIIHLGVKRTMPQLLRLSEWLCAGGSRMIQEGIRPSWHSPNGLKIQSYSSITRKSRLLLTLSGRKVAIQVRDNENAPLSTLTSHITADYVHSMDAAFLQRFVYQWPHEIVTVHDCFGTTLDKVGELRRSLCETFHDFYQQDHLMQHYGFLRGMGIDIGLPPQVHSLNPECIGENPFLFC